MVWRLFGYLLKGNTMIAKNSYALTADGEAVLETDLKADTLLVAEGGYITAEDAKKYGVEAVDAPTLGSDPPGPSVVLGLGTARSLDTTPGSDATPAAARTAATRTSE